MARSLEKIQYYVRVKAQSLRQAEVPTNDTNMLWNPTRPFATDPGARPPDLAATGHMLTTPSTQRPVFHNSTYEPEWMNPEVEARLVDSLQTMPAQPDVLDVRPHSAEGQRVHLMLKSADSWVTIRRTGHCPNVGNYQNIGPPDDLPLHVETRPEIDFQITFKLHTTILMAQRIAQVQMLRAGCSPDLIESVRQNLWELILMQGLILNEHPDLHESPQKLIWIQGRVGTMAWHRARYGGIPFPDHIAVHPPMTMRAARLEVAREITESTKLKLYLATCEEQGPNPSTYHTESAKGYFCPQCGITAEAGAIQCPICDRTPLE